MYTCLPEFPTNPLFTSQILYAAIGVSIGGDALVNVDLNASVLSGDTCGANEVLGVDLALLPLLRVCACVGVGSVIGTYDPTASTAGNYQCATCTDPNAHSVCLSSSSSGACACACNDGYYSDTVTGTCVKTTTCVAPFGTLVTDSTGATSTCQCSTGYAIDSATGQCDLCAAGYTKQADGTCALVTASQRARLRKRIPERLAPGLHGFLAGKHHGSKRGSHHLSKRGECPEKGETACPLKSGDFECIDTSSDLASCGGCVGDGDNDTGENCLAIPGALNVECFQSKCQVSSCFRGWYFDGSRCTKGERQ